MSDKAKLVPEIRFKGYTDAWVQRKLGEYGNFYYGKSAPKWSVTDDATTPCVRYGELYTKFDGKIDRIYSYTNIPPDQLKFSTGKEVLVPRVGEEPMDFAKCSWLSLPNVAIGEMISVYNTKQNPLFVAFYCNAMLKTQFAERVEGGNVSNLYYDRLVDIAVRFPSIAEQTKIADLIDSMNTAIALHQRKLDALRQLKKAYLQQMFPQAGERVPRMRFAGFTDTWEQRKFDFVFDPIPNNTLSRAALNYDSGEIKSVHYGDILIKYGSIIDCRNDEIPYITGGNVADYKSQILCDGDILIADAAEDETVGKCTEIAGIDGNFVVSGLHTVACRPKIKMQPHYLGYYMNSLAYHRQLLPFMQGIKVLSISRSNLAKTTIAYPASEEEQHSIGSTFAALDRLITLHQRKLERVHSLKKAYLQKMFV